MSVLGCVSPEVDAEARLWMQVVYIRSDPRKHQYGSKKVDQERKASLKRVSYWAGFHHGELENSAQPCRPYLRVFPPGK